MGDGKAPTLWPSAASAVIKNDHGEEVVVGKCRRATFFRYVKDNLKFYEDKYKHWSVLVEEIKDKERKPDRYLMWIWQAGQLYEDQFVELCKRAGVYIAEQIPLYIKTHNISGKVDFVALNPHTGKYHIVEIKSVYGFGKESVCGKPASARRPQKNGEPRDSNLMQIAIYDWWHASADPQFSESRLAYGARDTGHYSEYVVTTVEENNVVYIEYQQIARTENDQR